jgi:hypothetical protein
VHLLLCEKSAAGKQGKVGDFFIININCFCLETIVTMFKLYLLNMFLNERERGRENVCFLGQLDK